MSDLPEPPRWRGRSPKPPPLVVLDTTEVTRDWFLAGLEFQLLRYLIGHSRTLEVVVPETVVAEAVANNAKEYSRALRSLMKAEADLVRAAGRSFYPSGTPETYAYEDVLRERLDSVGIDAVPPPEVAHTEIVARAIARTPPFDASGSGYRDTLTWLTCMEFAKAGREVLLVSQDKDFANKEGHLATALQQEASETSGSVKLVRSLGPWLKEFMGNNTSLPDAAGLARDEAVASMFAPWDMFDDPGLTAEQLGLPRDAEIHHLEYYGSGDAWIENLGHERMPDGADRVIYKFPIEFEAFFSLDTEEARAAGLIQQEGSATGREEITTVIAMTGMMSMIHDERNPDGPFYLESFDFYPGEARPGLTWPEQTPWSPKDDSQPQLPLA